MHRFLPRERTHLGLMLGAVLLFLVGLDSVRAGISLGPIYPVAGSAVGGGGDVGQYASIDVDDFGGIHIAYYDVTHQRLKYARRGRANLPWSFQVVDAGPDAGRYARLAIGPRYVRRATANWFNGSDLLSLYTGGELNANVLGGRVERLNGGGWYVIVELLSSTMVRINAPYAGTTEFLAASTLEYFQPKIAYQKTYGNLGAALNLANPLFGFNFDLDQVEPLRGSPVQASTRTGYYADLVISTTGTMHLLWQNRDTLQATPGTVMYSTLQTSYSLGPYNAYSFDTRQGWGTNTRLAVDAQGIPMTIYRNESLQQLQIYRQNPMTLLWGNADIGYNSVNPGRSVDIAYSPAQNRFFAGYSAELTSATVQALATKSMSATTAFIPPDQPQLLGTGVGAAEYNAVACGNGPLDVYQLYYQSGNGTLNGVKMDGSATTYSEPVVLDGRTNVGRYVSAAVNPVDNKCYAAYYDATVGALKMATFDGVTTAAEYVDGMKSGTYASIGATSDEIVVAYYSDTEGCLRVARWKRGTLPGSPGSSDVVVDNSTAQIGEYCSLVTDAANRIHIIYYDRIRHQLRYAVYNQGAWYTKTIAVSNQQMPDLGEYCRLAINPDKTRLATVFYERTGKQLMVGRGDVPAVGAGDPNTSFTITTAGSSPNSGRFCSLAYAPIGDDLFAAYHSDATQGLEVIALSTSGSLPPEPVESGVFNQVGYYTSVGWNPLTNLPMVAYYDVSNGTLKFAEKVNGGWIIRTLDNLGDSGLYPVLLIDGPRNAVTILYYSASYGEYRAMTRALGGIDWTGPTALASGERGVRPSAIIDEVSGNILTSFFDDASGDLLTSATGAPVVVTAAGPGWSAYE